MRGPERTWKRLVGEECMNVVLSRVDFICRLMSSACRDTAHTGTFFIADKWRIAASALAAQKLNITCCYCNDNNTFTRHK